MTSRHDEPPLAERQPVPAENDRQLEDVPNALFSTTEDTDRLLCFLASSKGGDKPEKLAELTAAWAENEARIAERALP